MIRLGYVGQNLLLPSPSKTFRIGNYSKGRMLQVGQSNLNSLEEILKWNIEHKIYVFRITSHLIPYGSSPINKGEWIVELKESFIRIGNYILNNGIRVSMHPGQYTVLNTPNLKYLDNTIADLNYHNQVLSLLGVDTSSKIIIHGGGSYGNKKDSLNRLGQRLLELPRHLKERLVIENDDKIFTADEILRIAKQTNTPAVFDVFHHQCNPSLEGLSAIDIILQYKETWGNQRQKIHYSEQDPKKHKGAHSETINPITFLELYNQIKELDLDVMLEVKDKQESVLLLQRKMAKLAY